MTIVKTSDHPCSINIPDEIPACKQLVYGLTDPRNNEIYYVGKVKRDRVKARMQHHCATVYSFDAIRPAGIYWPKSFRLKQRKVDIYNAGLVTQMSILAVCDSEESAIAVEKAMIERYRKTALNTRRG